MSNNAKHLVKIRDYDRAERKIALKLRKMVVRKHRRDTRAAKGEFLNTVTLHQGKWA